ncbi:MAG: hypothetical protein H7062_19655 [Candidatus Saccharimonas sp.]|nr:hypothetical protein [Planctomycetaceae bacterium]
MSQQKLVTHGVTAAAALVVGGLCGYGFAPAARVSADVSPTQVVRNIEMQPNAVASTLAARSVEPTGSAAAEWKLKAGKGVTAAETIQCSVPKGWPVIAVRAMDEDAVWYVQVTAVPTEGRNFDCPTIYGNATTPVGTKFQTALIVARDAEDAEQFAPGAMLKELPTNREVVSIVDVVRE